MVVATVIAMAVLLFLSKPTRVLGERDFGVYCGACHGLFDEIEFVLTQVHPTKRINVGSFARPSSVTYARSETHLTEVMETVCNEMENYSNFVEHGKTVYRRSVCSQATDRQPQEGGGGGKGSRAEHTKRAYTHLWLGSNLRFFAAPLDTRDAKVTKVLSI